YPSEDSADHSSGCSAPSYLPYCRASARVDGFLTWQIASDILGKVHDRHGLEPDLAGSRQRGEEEAFASENDVSDSAHHRNIGRDRRLLHTDVTGVHAKAFAAR